MRTYGEILEPRLVTRNGGATLCQLSLVDSSFVDLLVDTFLGDVDLLLSRLLLGLQSTSSSESIRYGDGSDGLHTSWMSISA
jgi:hypothetical protein